jgi:hypothetical protein
VLVFQFAGHGTQLPDADADEEDPGGVDQDEALCPFDHVSGEYIVDDDLAALFMALPQGVNLTCFIDCCHSGTICRIAAPPGRRRRTRARPPTGARGTYPSPRRWCRPTRRCGARRSPRRDRAGRGFRRW